jgi:hypothetical protein
LCGAVHALLVDLPHLRASAPVFISNACFPLHIVGFGSRWSKLLLFVCSLCFYSRFPCLCSQFGPRSPARGVHLRSSSLIPQTCASIWILQAERLKKCFSCASFLSRVIVQVLDFSLGSSFSAPMCKSRRQKFFHRGPALGHLFLLWISHGL